MSFLRRQGQLRGLDRSGAINPSVAMPLVAPELQPGDGIQAHMNSASLQGGGEIRLGPYEFRVFRPLSVPANVTLVGVPNMTKLTKVVPAYYTLAEYDEANDLGPVVKVLAGGAIKGVTVDLQLPTTSGGVSWRAGGSGRIYNQYPDRLYYDTGTSDYIDLVGTDWNSVILCTGARTRVEGCVIPDMFTVGIRLKNTAQSMIINNRIGFSVWAESGFGQSGIYAETGSKYDVILGNIVVGIGGAGHISTDEASANNNAVGAVHVVGDPKTEEQSNVAGTIAR